MTTHQPIDVAIIGGGPAGYAAAIYAARSNLTTTVIEQGMSGGQIATTNEVENYPGIPLLSGVELGERFQQHAEGLGAQVTWSMVTGIDYDADTALFTVHHDMGDTLASSVIACMGATPRSAGFVGEDTYRGRGVSYCATCDGMFFRGKQVFVIGGGNAAWQPGVHDAGAGAACAGSCGGGAHGLVCVGRVGGTAPAAAAGTAAGTAPDTGPSHPAGPAGTGGVKNKNPCTGRSGTEVLFVNQTAIKRSC